MVSQGRSFAATGSTRRGGNKVPTSLEREWPRDWRIRLPSIPDRSTCISNPACGVGDLLLAVAKKLPVGDTLQSTVDDWSKRLAGCDISTDFVRLAKARLVLLAAGRCRVDPSGERVALTRTFPDIVEADFLSYSQGEHHANVVVMNPPFGYTQAAAGCKWATGRINAAALFTERAIQNASDGTRNRCDSARCAPIGKSLQAVAYSDRRVWLGTQGAARWVSLRDGRMSTYAF